MGEQRELWGAKGVTAGKASPGAKARDDAIDRVETNADPNFKYLAYKAGCDLASRGQPFTSADIRDYLQRRHPKVKTHDDRALGPVMRRLQGHGVIEPTGQYVPQPRARNHCRPLREWRARRQ